MIALRNRQLQGLGIAHLPAVVVRDDLAAGRPDELVPGWAPKCGIVHAIFPSRRGFGVVAGHADRLPGEEFSDSDIALQAWSFQRLVPFVIFKTMLAGNMRLKAGARDTRWSFPSSPPESPMSVPAFGLGRYVSPAGPGAIDSVSTALELGYRAIDTAQIYDNGDVGEAIAASGINRQALVHHQQDLDRQLRQDNLIASLKDSPRSRPITWTWTLDPLAVPENQVPVEESWRPQQARELELTPADRGFQLHRSERCSKPSTQWCATSRPTRS